MKEKLLIIILFLIGCKYVIAQHDYIPLAVENAQWIIYVGDDDYLPPFNEYYYGYKIEGDIIINSVPYKKVFKRHFTPVNIDLGNPVVGPFYISDEYFYGAIRDDIPNKSVYGLEFCGSQGYGFCDCDIDFLMFDFSMEVGDIHTDHCLSCNFYQVEYISEMNIWGDIRLVQNTNSSPEVFEGVGHSFGLFEPFIAPAFRSLDGPTLYDFCIGTDEQCLDGFLLATQDQILPNEYFSVYPNPFNESFTVSSEMNYPNSVSILIEVTDITGRQITKTTIKSKSEIIDASKLNSGLYYVNLYNNKQLLATKEIIKL